MPKEAEVPPQQGRPEEGDGKAYEPFHLREKIEEMVLYAWEPVTQFPRKDRALSDKLKELMCDLCDLSIQIDNRHMRKTTANNLDDKLDSLRFFVRQTKSYTGANTRHRSLCTNTKSGRDITTKSAEFWVAT